jgi:hypothetical protein
VVQPREEAAGHELNRVPRRKFRGVSRFRPESSGDALEMKGRIERANRGPPALADNEGDAAIV